ncbi:TPA: hypothetical protein MCM29_005095 [Klebsiella pneumoniae]|nr:hypothetical protein [Klebsiella pneumoniae]
MKLTKEQMFDFILNNVVTVLPGGEGWWTRHDEEGNVIERYRNKYTVSINEAGMLGMDLEEAIQYYHDNYGDKNEV